MLCISDLPTQPLLIYLILLAMSYPEGKRKGIKLVFFNNLSEKDKTFRASS